MWERATRANVEAALAILDRTPDVASDVGDERQENTSSPTK